MRRRAKKDNGVYKLTLFQSWSRILKFFIPPSAQKYVPNVGGVAANTVLCLSPQKFLSDVVPR